MNEKKMEELLMTRINGNISVFNEAVKKMRKIDLLDYIEYSWSTGRVTHEAIVHLRKALEK